MVAIGCDIGSNSEKSDFELMMEKMDRHKASAAQARQQLLNARGLEIVKGSLHEASDLSQQAQKGRNMEINFNGSVSVSLSDGETTKVSVVDCHPCSNWPPAPQQDMTCFVALAIESSSLEEAILIDCHIGGGMDGKGEFIIHLPKDQAKRAIALTMIKDIAGTQAAPARLDLNRVLRQGFGLIKNANRDQVITELVAMLCKVISLKLSKKSNY